MSTLTTTNDNATPASDTRTVIRGTAGDDTLEGGAGRDILDAGDGDDFLHDEEGDNLLLGGAGSDTLVGSGVFNGGPGDDAIAAAGDASGNIYQYASADGFDTISANTEQTALSGQGCLQFGQGVTPSSVGLVRDDDHLSFYLSPTDQVTLLDWFKGPAFQLDRVRFADGTTWQANDIAAMDITVLGTEHDDVMHGYAGNNLIHAGAGDDYVIDDRGNNIIYGGAGDDVLMGRGVLDGGHGNDTLLAVGDAGHNVYFFDVGDGEDTLYAHGDGNPGIPQGTVAFGEHLDSSRLWFRRQDADLAVIVIGSSEGMIVKDWYQHELNRVARFMSGDDRILSHDKVDALVLAMAAFDPPLAGAERLDEPVGQALAPVLAASWT